MGVGWTRQPVASSQCTRVAVAIAVATREHAGAPPTMSNPLSFASTSCPSIAARLLRTRTVRLCHSPRRPFRQRSGPYSHAPSDCDAQSTWPVGNKPKVHTSMRNPDLLFANVVDEPQLIEAQFVSVMSAVSEMLFKPGAGFFRSTMRRQRRLHAALQLGYRVAAPAPHMSPALKPRPALSSFSAA